MSHYSRGLDTYNTILKHSLDLFSEKGYDATSVAEICQNAQVSKGAFYHHFPSKQDLFLALMTSWLDRLDELFRAAGESAQDVPAALEGMASISGGIFDELERGFPILLEFWRQASRESAFWEKAVAPYHRFLQYFEGMIRSGIDVGAFEENLDPGLASRILMAVAMGLLLQASFDPDGANWQDITYSGIKILLNGIRRQV